MGGVWQDVKFQFYRQLLDNLEAAPGMRSAALAEVPS